MATNIATPGVYIDEVSTLPASVVAVETAIPAFIGNTETLDKDGVTDALKNVPTRITSMAEYKEVFGGPKPETVTVTVTDDYDDGVVTRAIATAFTGVSDFKLFYQLQMFFANGGGPCYVVAVNNYGTVPGSADMLAGLTAIEKVDEPTLLVFPDQLATATINTVYESALAQCNKLQDRFTIMDVKTETGDTIVDATAFRAIGIDNLKYGAVYYPFLNTILNFGIDESVVVTHNTTGTSPPTAPPPITLAAHLTDTDALRVGPSLYTEIMAEFNKAFVDLAPSGAVAGIYARVDADRGVWKAPANVGVRFISDLSFKVTEDEQKALNVDSTAGKSINVIRSFTGIGNIVWGARTLAGNDNEWRYVPVRRLFIMAEESIQKATEFVVFEPNDANTWLRTKTMIENFLSTLWRQGALAGAKPEDAFFVNVGLGETMSSQDILEGRLIIEVGMAAVRPAEFIILRFSHKLQES